MKKGMRITFAIIAAAVAVSVFGYAIGSGLFSFKVKDAETTAPGDITTAVVQPSADIQPGTEPSLPVQQPQTTAPEQEETTAAKAKRAEKQLLGSWTDGAGMSGFEFFEDGTVKVTYVNVTLPIVNMPVNGSYNGTYVIHEDEITMSFSIYTATIINKYRFEVTDTQLTLTNVEDNKRTVYMKTVVEKPTSQTQPSAASNAAASSEIVGTWLSNDNNTVCTFGSDGAFAVTYKTARKTVAAGSYDGIFIYDGDTLTVQYTADRRITEKYACTVNKNSLTLTDSASIQQFFTREGTGSVGVSASSELLGKWSDGANMSGYEFHEDGLVTATYVNINIPVVNIPITGTYDGAYSISGDKLSISFSIYGNVVRRTFTYSIEGNSLYLTDEADGRTTTYLKNR